MIVGQVLVNGVVYSCHRYPEPQQTVAAAIGGGDPLGYVLTGGDDHALLATFAPADVPAGWTVIGRVAAATVEPDVLVDGKPWEGGQGWRHF